MRFCDWLKQNRINRNMKQSDLARILGKKQAYISLLESSCPTPAGEDLIHKIADYFNANYKEILIMVTMERLPDYIREDYSNFMNGLEYAVTNLNIKSIPLIPKIPEGFTRPNPSMKYEVIQLFENSLNLYHADLDFFTKATDDALLKKGIKKDDVCLISLYKEQDLNYETVLAEIDEMGEKSILMRTYHCNNNFVFLLPENSDYQPKVLPENDVRVIGVVLKSIRLFNHLKNTPLVTKKNEK